MARTPWLGKLGCPRVLCALAMSSGVHVAGGEGGGGPDTGGSGSDAVVTLGALTQGVLAAGWRLQPHALQTLAIAVEAALQEAHGASPEVCGRAWVGEAGWERLCRRWGPALDRTMVKGAAVALPTPRRSHADDRCCGAAALACRRTWIGAGRCCTPWVT
jgi:hypothetical protein